MDNLEGIVPYSLRPGNHDYPGNAKNKTRETKLNEYFPFEAATKEHTFGGVMEEEHLENSYHTFEANGQKFLVLALEFGPRVPVVEWAARIVKEHSQHHVLLTTHASTYHDDTRYDWATYGNRQRSSPYVYNTSKLPGGTTDGQDLWDKLNSQHSNILMSLSGHVIGDGLGRLASAGLHGNVVHEMLVNYQMKREGGQGYLRLLEFLPDNTTVQVKCYSPSVDRHKTDSQNQFVLKLNPRLGPRHGQ